MLLFQDIAGRLLTIEEVNKLPLWAIDDFQIHVYEK